VIYDREKESLKDEMRNLVEEARMVIPGIQALFGFQTMAVFNNRFEQLPGNGKIAYLAALALLILAMALMMTPAAYHRLVERGQVSRQMINMSSNLVTIALVPLLLAFALDVYVVVLAALDDQRCGLIGGAATVVVLAGAWFAFPVAKKKWDRGLGR
jgi:cobalamin synthase